MGFIAIASQLCCDAHCRSKLQSNLSPVRRAPAKTCVLSLAFIFVLRCAFKRRKAALGGPIGNSAWAEVVSRRLFPLLCGIAFKRPGSDLLSHVLRRSTIGAGAFHGRVRNGNGCGRPAMTTRSFKGNVMRSWFTRRVIDLNTSLHHGPAEPSR